MRAPIVLGSWGLTVATASGIAFMAAGGAPPRMMLLNGIALAIGLTVIGLPRMRSSLRAQDIAMTVAAAILCCAALYGPASDGIRRWLTVGPIVVHAAMLLLPVMLVVHARSPRVVSTATLSIAALALAIGPDRGSALAFVVAACALAGIRRGRHDAIVLGVGMIAFVVTLVRPDTLAGVRFVETVFGDAWRLSPAIGVAVTIGLTALLLPLAAVRRVSPDDRAIIGTFAAWTGGLILAALIGAYPTPVVGAGASAILGYAIGMVGLRRRFAMPDADDGDCRGDGRVA